MAHNKFDLMAIITELEPQEFLGLAHLLCVPLFENGNAKDFYDILGEVARRFDSLPRRQKKEVKMVLRALVKKEVNARNAKTCGDPTQK